MNCGYEEPYNTCNLIEILFIYFFFQKGFLKIIHSTGIFLKGYFSKFYDLRKVVSSQYTSLPWKNSFQLGFIRSKTGVE
jgi:hypothetical protein